MSYKNISFYIDNELYNLKTLNSPNPNANILYMHVLNFDFLDEYKYILPFFDGIEIKPEIFSRKVSLFYWNNDRFCYIKENIDRLYNVCNNYNLKVQIHFPYRKFEGKILDTSNPKDHQVLLHVFSVYNELMEKYSFGPNITIHPPEISNHLDSYIIKDTLLYSNEFFQKLGEQIKCQNSSMLIGLENQPDYYIHHYPKSYLGYEIEHFRLLLKDTPSCIQTTLDSGHKMLAKNFPLKDFLDFCSEVDKHIINFHFHKNNFFQKSLLQKHLSSDTHQFATASNFKDYMFYVLHSIIENIPLNLEISFKQYNREEILDYVSSIRNQIDNFYNQIKTTK